MTDQRLSEVNNDVLTQIMAAVKKMTPAERDRFEVWLLMRQRAPWWQRMRDRIRKRRLRVVDGGRQPWREGPHR
jgi:hypothetical protein